MVRRAMPGVPGVPGLVSTFVIVLLAVASASAATIKGPPIASQRRVQLLARLGEEVKLVCPMEGNPTPIIEWSKGDMMVDYQMTRYRTSKKSLKIRDVDKTDSGRFTCKGINGFGKVEIELDLMVIDPADFPGLPEGELPDIAPPLLTSDTTSSRTDFHKKPEEALRIACGALGKPRPQITWYKNGHELLENVREKHGRSVLHLRGLMVRDSGVYSCVARNMVGEAGRNFTVAVEDEASEPPNFAHSPTNRTVREGETATFDCRVRSLSMPHIRWLKKVTPGETGYSASEEIPVGQDRYRLINSSREIPLTQQGEILSQLVLRGVEPGHAGMYVCFVTSPRGGFNYRPAFLTIIPKTESLVAESPAVLVLVILLPVAVLAILAAIACVVRRRSKEPITPPDTAEVRHSLMPPPPSTTPVSYSSKCEPLPPPPTPAQWSHLYTPSTASSHYEGPTYEVPHLHGAPAAGGRYGYSGAPSYTGYPPPAKGYPPSYPPSIAGYPPSSTCYPPSNAGYPPGSTGYPPGQYGGQHHPERVGV